MRRFAAAALVLAVLLLGASSAYSQPQRARDVQRPVKLTINGRGSVTLGKNFTHPVTLSCNRSCTHIYLTSHLRSAITEKPHKGWKFAGWSGNCKNKTRTCVVHFGADPYPGVATAHVSARFIR